MFTNKNVKFCYMTSDEAGSPGTNRLAFGYAVLDGIIHIGLALCRKEDKFSKEEARKVIIDRLLKGNDAYVFRLTRDEFMSAPAIGGTLSHKLLPNSEEAIQSAFQFSLSPDAQKRMMDEGFAIRMNLLLGDMLRSIRLEDISYQLMNEHIVTMLAVNANKRVRNIIRSFCG